MNNETTNKIFHIYIHTNIENVYKTILINGESENFFYA